MDRNFMLKQIETSLESNISELSQALTVYADASNLDERDTMDPDDYSQQSDSKEMEMRMQIQLDQAKAQLEHFHELAAKKITGIESGAIVETDRNLIFIGVSFANLHLDGKELIGITTESPAYVSLRGKQPGDSITLGKTEYKIKKVY